MSLKFKRYTTATLLVILSVPLLLGQTCGSTPATSTETETTSSSSIPQPAPSPDTSSSAQPAPAPIQSNDSDGDSIVDSKDNCPSTYNPGQEDADQDGIGDACDLNYANDGKGQIVFLDFHTPAVIGLSDDNVDRPFSETPWLTTSSEQAAGTIQSRLESLFNGYRICFFNSYQYQKPQNCAVVYVGTSSDKDSIGGHASIDPGNLVLNDYAIVWTNCTNVSSCSGSDSNTKLTLTALNIAHELGHLLGLRHTNVSNDIMSNKSSSWNSSAVFAVGTIYEDSMSTRNGQMQDAPAILLARLGATASCDSVAPSTKVPTITTFAINNGEPTTTNRTVVLNNTCTGKPIYYAASEVPSFQGASWQTYSASPSFTLSSGNGTKTVYFMVKNVGGVGISVGDTITLNETTSAVDIPTFSPDGGTFTSSQSVTFSCSTSGAIIRYTTDGSTPSQSNGTVISSGSSINITSTITIKAIAYKSGMTDSTVKSATFTITPPQQVASPTFSPDGGSFTAAQSVTISCSTSGATIRYTTDGNAPSQSNGTVIGSGSSVNLTSTVTLIAIAYKAGMTDSAIISATFTINAMQQVAQPTFNPDGGTFTSSQSVTISSATSGATIRYTTDGSTPSQSNGTFISSGSSVNLTSTTTLKAIAYKTGMTNSTVKSATYTKSGGGGGTGETFTITLPGNVPLILIRIPAGTFQMGDNGGNGPVHTVTISNAFYIGKYEVSQTHWRAVMNSSPSYFTGDNRPVEQVSWNDCQSFCQAVQTQTGYAVRLPTEAQWEYACRAGTTTIYSFGNDTGQLGTYAWYYNNSSNQSHDVGGKQPNAWGLYDMHGNVFEWCQDWYGEYSSESQTNPTGQSSGSYRVLRGGSWYDPNGYCLFCASRYFSSPSSRDGHFGFRLALDAN